MEEVGGGGGGISRFTCLRMERSSSSCLRNRLFSLLSQFNWRDKERDNLRETIYAQKKTKRITIVLKENHHVRPWNRLREAGKRDNFR